MGKWMIFDFHYIDKNTLNLPTCLSFVLFEYLENNEQMNKFF